MTKIANAIKKSPAGSQRQPKSSRLADLGWHIWNASCFSFGTTGRWVVFDYENNATGEDYAQWRWQEWEGIRAEAAREHQRFLELVRDPGYSQRLETEADKELVAIEEATSEEMRFQFHQAKAVTVRFEVPDPGNQ